MRLYSCSILIFLMSIFSIGFAKEVSSIHVSGNYGVSKSAIVKAAQVKVGQDLSSEDLIKIIHNISNKLQIERVNVSLVDGKLIIHVKESLKISKVTLNLSGGINKENAKKVLKEYDVQANEYFSDKNMQLVIRALKDISEQMGYNDVEISVDYKVLKSQSLAIEISIHGTEGYIIRALSFDGATRFSDRQLNEISRLSVTGLLSPLTGDDYFSQLRLKIAQGSLYEAYANIGYYNVKIRTDIEKFVASKQVSIKFVIDEGELTKINSVSFKGIPDAPAKKLESIGIKKGEPFARNRMRLAEDILENHYSDQGRHGTDVKTFIKPIGRDLVDLSFNVKKTKPVKIRFIQFMGNNKTLDATMRHYFEIVEGELYSKTKIERALIRLRDLAYLESADFEVIPVKGVKDTVDVVIKIKEGKSTTISMKGSYDARAGLVFSSEFSDQNFLGTGKMLSVDIERALNGMNKFNINAYSPISYLNQNWSESFGLGYQSTVANIQKSSTNDNAKKASSENRYISKKFYLSVIEHIPYDSNTSFLLGIQPSFRHIENAKEGSIARIFEDKHGATFRDLQLISGLKGRYRDQYIGNWDGDLKLTYSPNLSGTISYFKLYSRLEGHMKLIRIADQDVELNPVFKYGFGAGIGNETSFPYFQKFIVGQDITLRGFDQTAVGPYNLYTGQNNMQVVDYIGGDSFGSLNLSLWLPSFNPEMFVPGVYLDAVSISSKDYPGTGLRYSSGFAMKFNTPMGMMNAAYALTTHKSNDHDNEERFWISMSGNL